MMMVSARLVRLVTIQLQFLMTVMCPQVKFASQLIARETFATQHCTLSLMHMVVWISNVVLTNIPMTIAHFALPIATLCLSIKFGMKRTVDIAKFVMTIWFLTQTILHAKPSHHALKIPRCSRLRQVQNADHAHSNHFNVRIINTCAAPLYVKDLTVMATPFPLMENVLKFLHIWLLMMTLPQLLTLQNASMKEISSKSVVPVKHALNILILMPIKLNVLLIPVRENHGWRKTVLANPAMKVTHMKYLLMATIVARNLGLI